MKKYLLVIFCICLLAVTPAMADLVTPTLGTGVNDDEDFFSALYGDPVTLISKQPDNEGVLPDELIVDPTDPTEVNSATISWDLTGDGYIALYVAVKDGSTVGPEGQQWLYYVVTPAQQVIGGGTVSTTVFEPGAGDISHISLYGIEGTGVNGKVPEPATMILLGSGLLGLAGYARRRMKK